MLSAAIIADDLTGAADCASAFAGADLAAFVALGEASPASARVVAWDLDSRAAAPREAAARAHAAASRAIERGARVLYKKIDSTLRGHVGAEVAAVFRASARAGERPVVIAAPAFPAQGRTLSAGRVQVHGVPLAAASPAGERDDLVSLLAGAGLRTVCASRAALRDAILPAAAEAVVCDAADEADLRRIAGLGAALQGRVIWVGSGGLARHLPAVLGFAAAVLDPAAARAVRRLEPRPGPLLIVSGSRSAAALGQAAFVCAEPGVERFELEPVAVLAGERVPSLEGGRVDPGSHPWAAAAAGAAGALSAGRDVVLTFAQAAPSQVDPASSRALAAALGRLAAPLCSRAAGLVATGGDTARALLEALGATGVFVAGEVEPGVPIGLLDLPRGLPLISKAGGFGDQGTLSRCRAALHGGTR